MGHISSPYGNQTGSRRNVKDRNVPLTFRHFNGE